MRYSRVSHHQKWARTHVSLKVTHAKTRHNLFDKPCRIVRVSDMQVRGVFRTDAWVLWGSPVTPIARPPTCNGEALCEARPPTPTGARARSRPALRHGVGHHAQDLEHQIGPSEGGVARRVDRRRPLTDIPPMRCNPRNPRSITCASRMLNPPGSGAPVPMA